MRSSSSRTVKPAVVGRPCSSLTLMRTVCDGAGGEEHLDVVAEADVLAALADVEADERRALAGVAAVDLQDDVFDPEPRQPRPHRRLRVDRHVGPPFAHVRLGQHVLRLGRVAAAPRRRGRCSDSATASGAVTPASFSTLTRKSRVPPCTSSGGAAPCSTRTRLSGLMCTVHQHAAIEHALQRGDRRRFVAHADRVVERLHVGGGERFPEIPQRRLETPRLLREGLERDGLRGRTLFSADGCRRQHGRGGSGGTRDAVFMTPGFITCYVQRATVQRAEHVRRATCRATCQRAACDVLVPCATCYVRRATRRATCATVAARHVPQHVARQHVARRCT